MALGSGEKSKKRSKDTAPQKEGPDGVRAEGARATAGQPKVLRARRVARETENGGVPEADRESIVGAKVCKPEEGTGAKTPEERSGATPGAPSIEADGKIGNAEEVLALVKEMRTRLLDKEQVKPSVADFIRLLQLYREMAGEGPKEITVRWIDKESPGK